jgi:hypothetical protein
MVDARFNIGVGAWLMHGLVHIDVHVHGWYMVDDIGLVHG